MKYVFLIFVACSLFASCRHQDEFPAYLGDARQADYLNRATQISHVEIDQAPSQKLNFAMEPRRLSKQEFGEIWELTLSEVIQQALNNSRVIRNAGQFLSPGNPLLNNPEIFPSVYDPAIQETGVLFGSRGVEAALSDFDSQFTAQLQTGRNQSIQNNLISAGLPAGSELDETTDVLSMSLQKRFATGGQISLSHAWTHTGQNVPAGLGQTQLFTTPYEGSLQMQMRQPLLAGGGATYTRIAGPISANIQGVTGVQQGVLIARVDNDKELAEFELAVQQLLLDVEQLYWQLYQAYLRFDIETELIEAANRSLESLRSQLIAGTGASGSRIADVEQVLYEAHARADLAQDEIYSTEAQLRRLMGLPVNDGLIIRPSDEPIEVEVILDWETSLNSALVHRPELRRQKWSIKSLQLQLVAAENLLMPRLDLVSSYRINGFGDELFGERDDSTGTAPARIDNYYESILESDQTGWNVGLEFNLPLGRRFAKAQVKSLEFKLAKARAILSEQEVEMSYEIAAAFRDIDRAYHSIQNVSAQYQSASAKLSSLQAQYDANSDLVQIESVLDSQIELGRLESLFVSSVTEYNRAIANLYFRMGTNVDLHNIRLMEGPWVEDAYIDAIEEFDRRRFAEPAKHRDQPIYLDTFLTD